jgi:hypothetical protein
VTSLTGSKATLAGARFGKNLLRYPDGQSMIGK